MITYNVEKISSQWIAFEPLLYAPRTDTEYDKLADFLDFLVDIVGDNEKHPLASLMDTVGTLIESYDNEHYPFSEGNPIEALKYFVEIHSLTQNDLPEIGNPDVVSEILKGKRSLNVEQIRELGKRFNVSPATFI